MILAFILYGVFSFDDFFNDKKGDKECRDKSSWCSKYRPHCTKGMHFNTWAMKKCRKTCGICKVDDFEFDGQEERSSWDLDCKDTATWCAKYTFYCGTGLYPEMKHKCKKTCNFCGKKEEKKWDGREVMSGRVSSWSGNKKASGNTACRDNSMYCKKYRPHCNKGMPWHGWMMKFCPVTCGTCGGGGDGGYCKDTVAWCGSYKNQCSTDVGHYMGMSVKCKKSCNLC